MIGASGKYSLKPNLNAKRMCGNNSHLNLVSNFRKIGFAVWWVGSGPQFSKSTRVELGRVAASAGRVLKIEPVSNSAPDVQWRLRELYYRPVW